MTCEARRRTRGAGEPEMSGNKERQAVVEQASEAVQAWRVAQETVGNLALLAAFAEAHGLAIDGPSLREIAEDIGRAFEHVGEDDV